MTTNFKYVQAQDFFLAGSGSIVGATSIILKSFKAIDGTTNLTMTDFGTIGFATIEPGNGTQEEQISFTGVTQNSNGTATLTGVKHVLFVNPYTATSGTTLTHAGSTTLIITNTSGFYDQFPAKDNDETITGQWTFNSFPVTPATPTATTAVLGMIKTSVAPVSAASPIAVETSDPRVPVAYAADSVGTDAYAITPSPAITAYATGQVFTFKAGTSNTGACTLNVSALGAKDIKKNNSAALETGDIISGQIVMVEYDGTNMQMLSPGSGLINTTTLASTTVKGIVEQATPAEFEAGTAAGATGAQLFINPADTPAKHLIGALGNTVAKTYFNMQLPFTLWTGSTAGALTTDFPNWTRNSTDVDVVTGGAMAKFAGTGADTLCLVTFAYIDKANSLKFSDTNTIIMDWWAIMEATATGDLNMGMVKNDTSALIVAYNDSVQSRVVFAQDGTDGKIYATIAKAATGVTNTEITGITVTNWNNYRIELDLGTEAKFYVNGVLKATLSGANLETANNVLNLGFGRSDTSLFAVTAPNMSLQLI